jgi:hypothetical protein
VAEKVEDKQILDEAYPTNQHEILWVKFLFFSEIPRSADAYVCFNPGS